MKVEWINSYYSADYQWLDHYHPARSVLRSEEARAQPAASRATKRLPPSLVAAAATKRAKQLPPPLVARPPPGVAGAAPAARPRPGHLAAAALRLLAGGGGACMCPQVVCVKCGTC